MCQWSVGDISLGADIGLSGGRRLAAVRPPQPAHPAQALDREYPAAASSCGLLHGCAAPDEPPGSSGASGSSGHGHAGPGRTHPTHPSHTAHPAAGPGHIRASVASGHPAAGRGHIRHIRASVACIHRIRLIRPQARRPWAVGTSGTSVHLSNLSSSSSG